MAKEVLPDCTQLQWKEEEISVEEKIAPKSPGLKYKHYAPKAKTVILQGEPSEVAERIQWALDNADKRGVKAKAMVSSELKEHFTGDNVVSLGSRNDGEAQAAALFRVLRDFDAEGVEEVYAEAMPEDGVGFAVMNRMYRAAGCKMVPVHHVEFVCTGNTCRSFMAEYILRSMLEKRMSEGTIEAAAVKVTSSGVFADTGSAGSRMAEEVLHIEYDIDGREHRARAFTYEIGQSADVILCMTGGHKLSVLRCFPEFEPKVFTLAEYGGGEDVQDPFAGSYMTYSRCAEQIKKLIENAKL